MDSLLVGLLDLSPNDATLTRRLTEQMRSLIATGRLKSGERIPSSRALATGLGISRNTVTQAIEQLAAEGYLEISQSRRPVVAAGASLLSGRRSSAPVSVSSRFQLSSWGRRLPRANWPSHDSGRPRAFLPGLADEREFPHDIWGRCLRHAASRTPPRIDRSQSDPALQASLLQHLATHRGIRAQPEQIFIVPSAQAGLALIARLTIDAGDVAWMESPGYGGASAALRAAGAKVVGVPIDADGLTIDHGREEPRLLFVTPSHQYPTGRLMPVTRRLELVRFANQIGAAIIEDDYDGDFHYDGRPVAALAGLHPGALVFYVGTFSKALSADIRIGYVIVPEPLAPAFALAQRHLGLLVSQTIQAALSEFIERGAYLSHIRRMTRIYGERRDHLVQMLAAEVGERLVIDVPAGGMQLLARCEPSIDDRKLSHRLHQAGVIARPLSDMLYHGARDRGLFLGFAAWNNDEITAGVRLIGRYMR
jgi:GntR family transcriptional regulator/MocR family aminotransferase